MRIGTPWCSIFISNVGRKLEISLSSFAIKLFIECNASSCCLSCLCCLPLNNDSRPPTQPPVLFLHSLSFFCSDFPAALRQP